MRIVLGTLLIDAVVRNYVTIISEYYRLIRLPEWSFGLLGAASAAVGFFVPTIAKWSGKRYSPRANLALVATIVFLCLLAVIPAIPYFFLPVVILFTSFSFLEFISSSTLNKLADSSQRATVLSVKGLCWNFGYGALALGYAGALGWFESREGSPGAALKLALPWQAAWFAITIVLFFLIFWRSARPSSSQ